LLKRGCTYETLGQTDGRTDRVIPYTEHVDLTLNCKNVKLTTHIEGYNKI